MGTGSSSRRGLLDVGTLRLKKTSGGRSSGFVVPVMMKYATEE